MTARVFISYRTSDGADKATALARDLDALFGEEQIFLDKDDLPAGSRWRDEIARTLEKSPILLVLVTPNYLGARDGQGKRCIERSDDPPRDELEAALAANAQVIPLMCDGVTRTSRIGEFSSVRAMTSRQRLPAGRSSLSRKICSSPNSASRSRARAVALSAPSLVR